jgi:uncharacterized membrane protein YtjA (UPF0391 family)
MLGDPSGTASHNAADKTQPCNAAVGVDKETDMYTFFMLGIIFLIISLVAYAFGARGTADASAGVGRTFLLVGLILAVLFVLVGLFRPVGWSF